MLPNFVVIGAQKSGTSSLHNYLRQHPDVAMCKDKEPDFFVAERNWNLGIDWYESLFDHTEGALAIGEASTSYTMFPHYKGVPQRIVETLGDVRLIYLIRNPIDRARSDYLHYRFPVRGKETQFVEAEKRPISQALFENDLYLDTSRYAMQLEQYLEVVARERILIVTTEDLATKRVETMGKIFSFLELDPSRAPDAFEKEYNRSDDLRVPRPLYERARQLPLIEKITGGLPTRVRMRIRTQPIDLTQGDMSDDLRLRISHELSGDVRRLKDLMDDDFDGWGMAQFLDNLDSRQLGL